MQQKENSMFERFLFLADKHDFLVKIHNSVLTNIKYKSKKAGRLLPHSSVQLTEFGFASESYEVLMYSIFLRKITKYIPTCLLLVQTVEVNLRNHFV